MVSDKPRRLLICRTCRNPSGYSSRTPHELIGSGQWRCLRCESVQNVVEAQDGATSIVARRDTDADTIMLEAEALVSKRIRARMIERLAASIEKDLRAGGPIPLPSNEEAAMAILKAAAKFLTDAGNALHKAAKRMKNNGDGVGANIARVEGSKALSAAQELVG